MCGVTIQPLVHNPSSFFFIYLNFSSLPSSPFSPFLSEFKPHLLVSFLSKILLFSPSQFPLFHVDFSGLHFPSDYCHLISLINIIHPSIFFTLPVYISLLTFTHCLAYYPLANEVAKGYIYTHTHTHATVRPSFHNILVNTLESTSFNGFWPNLVHT